MSIYDENDFTYNGRKPHALVSREQCMLYAGDKRYRGTVNERDEAYIRFVEACLCLTDDEHTGANIDLSGAPAEGDGQQFQDPANTLGGMRDVYRDMEEARVDTASSLYKVSAFERERVAQKIDRSTPNGTVATEKHHSIQVVNDESDLEEGGSL